MGRKLSHDLKGGNGKAKRGWKGLSVREGFGEEAGTGTAPEHVEGKLENGSYGS
jgi:hypothetical protein